MINKIYYLLDFHKKCNQIVSHNDDVIDKYCKFINLLFCKYFSSEEQTKLKMYNFYKKMLYQFGFEDIDDITFDGIDENNLNNFFDKISFICIENFY